MEKPRRRLIFKYTQFHYIVLGIFHAIVSHAIACHVIPSQPDRKEEQKETERNKIWFTHLALDHHVLDQ